MYDHDHTVDVSDYLVKCNRCKRRVPISDAEYPARTHTGGDNVICSHCYDVYYDTCYECEEVSPVVFLTSYDEHHYCDQCYRELFIVCCICGKVVDRDCGMVAEDEEYCEDCFTERYEICRYCDEPIPAHETHYIDGECYHFDCAYSAGYSLCEECGEWVTDDEAIYNDGVVVCEDCARSQESDIIYGYHDSNCDVTKYDVGEHPAYYLGVENELNYPYNADHSAIAREMLTAAPGLLFFERDGSIEHGFETITAPLSPAFWREHSADLCAALAVAVNKGADDNKDNLGLHVHISIKALGSDYNEVAATEAKLLYLSCKFDAELSTISRRYLGDSYYAKGIKDCNTIADAEDLAREYKSAHGSRYNTWNLTSLYTREFRRFAATTDPVAYLAAVWLVVAMVESARAMGTQEAQRCSTLREWLEFAGQLEPVADEYLKRFGL